MSVIAIKDSPSTVDFSFNSTFKNNVNIKIQYSVLVQVPFVLYYILIENVQP